MPDGFTGQFGIVLRCLQVMMAEQTVHCAYAHTAVHQFRNVFFRLFLIRFQ